MESDFRKKMKNDAPLEHFTPKPGMYMSGVVFTVTEIRGSRVSGEFFTHSGNERMGGVGFELDDVIKIVHPKYYEYDDPDDVYVPE